MKAENVLLHQYCGCKAAERCTHLVPLKWQLMPDQNGAINGGMQTLKQKILAAEK
jgi:hypothetical protein